MKKLFRYNVGLIETTKIKKLFEESQKHNLTLSRGSFRDVFERDGHTYLDCYVEGEKQHIISFLVERRMTEKEAVRFFNDFSMPIKNNFK